MSELRWSTADQWEGPPVLFEQAVERHIGRGAYRGLEFLHVEAKTLINRVPNNRMFPFEYTINAYRGCSHACTYCFARPTHEFLGLGIGEDFDSRIVVKINAPELIRRETEPRRWPGHPIAMGTNTDPYQPAEGKYKLTRRIVETLTERGNPFSILTKSPLVLRDLDLLREAASRTEVTINLSVPTLDREVWAASEPGTAHPRKRLDAVARLNEAGVPSGVLMMPILPGLSDGPEQIEEVVAGAAAAGARFITGSYLHLRGPLKQHYYDWVGEKYPDLLHRYHRFYRQGAYAPRPAGKRLGAMVNGLIRKHFGPRPRKTPRPSPTPAPAPPTQKPLIRFP